MACEVFFGYPTHAPQNFRKLIFRDEKTQRSFLFFFLPNAEVVKNSAFSCSISVSHSGAVAKSGFDSGVTSFSEMFLMREFAQGLGIPLNTQLGLHVLAERTYQILNHGRFASKP